MKLNTYILIDLNSLMVKALKLPLKHYLCNNNSRGSIRVVPLNGFYQSQKWKLHSSSISSRNLRV